MRARLCTVAPGRGPGRDRRRGRAAGGAHRVRRRPLAPDALVRPAADGRRQPARVRLHPAHHAAPVRAGARSGRPTRASRSSCGWASRCAASSRREANLLRGLRHRAARLRRAGAAETHADWRGHLDGIVVEGGVERAAHDLRDEPLPLADQAVLRPGREPVLVDVEVVRVRHRHDVGHLQDAAPAAHRARARPGRRAGVGAAVGAGGGGQLPDRLPDGPGRRPLLPPGAARWPTPSSPTCATLGLPGIDWEYALVHLHDDLRRIYGEDYLEKGVAHPITHTLDLAYGYHCTARVARHVGDHELADHLDEPGHPLGQRLRPGDRPADRLDVLRGRSLELLVPAAARHGGAHRAGRRRRRVRRHARPVLRLRRSRRSSS